MLSRFLSHVVSQIQSGIRNPPEYNEMIVQRFMFLCNLAISLFATVFVLRTKQKLCQTDYIKSQY